MVIAAIFFWGGGASVRGMYIIAYLGHVYYCLSSAVLPICIRKHLLHLLSIYISSSAGVGYDSGHKIPVASF